MPTTVKIIDSPGTRAAEPAQVTVLVGDTVTFSASAPAVLYLSSEAAAILSPLSESLIVEIAAGTPVTFTFSGTCEGTVCAQVMPPDLPTPTMDCVQVGAGVLSILPGSDPGYDTAGVQPGN